MVSSVNSVQNNSMKNSELNIGVLVPPNKIDKPVIYSDADASKQFKQLKTDIYAKEKHYTFEDTKSTPKLIKWGSILAGLSAAGLFILAKLKK